MNEDREYGFWEALFDLSFSKFVTVELIQILYIVGIMLAGLAAVMASVASFFNYGIAIGIFSTCIAGLVFILYALGLRVFLELFVVFFRIADYAKEVARNTER
jgi:hypothetical protein